jgi:predicted lipid-binding transport protein (Tim44 family)
MKKITGFILSAMIGFALVLVDAGDVYAARLGGGKSFGSRPSYSQPYRRSTDANQTSPAQQPAYQSPAAQRNQTAREAMAKRGGLMGMLGGLALGGLLGAMLFGGAFEHINFLDILIFGAIAYMLFRLFAARRSAGLGQVSAGGRDYHAARGPDADVGVGQVYERRAEEAQHSASRQAGFNTDVLFDKGGSAPSSAASTVPADFDSSAFLAGAKAAYEHLQRAWDIGDLAGLRALTTDKVFSELQDQIRQRVGENRTELLKVEAELLEVRDLGSDREASVLFDVILRESAEERPTQVREIWHFVRSKLSKQPTWFLDGIQQMDD